MAVDRCLVIPAKAGIQVIAIGKLDSGLRRNDQSGCSFSSLVKERG